MPRAGRRENSRHTPGANRPAAGGAAAAKTFPLRPGSKAFAEEAERQAKRLRGHPDEAEALDFIAGTVDWPEE